MTTLDDAKLDEIEKGCEGVTPGPWRVSRRYEIGPGSNADDQSRGMIIPFADVYGGGRGIDSAHIARLDPATVLELVRLARIGKAAEKAALEAVAPMIRKAALEEAAGMAMRVSDDYREGATDFDGEQRVAIAMSQAIGARAASAVIRAMAGEPSRNA